MSCLRKYYSRAFSHLQSRSSYSRSLNRDFLTNEATEVERRARALRILDTISSKSGGVSDRRNHHGIVQDFVQTDSSQFRGQAFFKDFDLSKAKDGISSVLKEVMLEESSSPVNSGLSSAVSSCVSNRDFKTGLGFHCLALKGGLFSDVYVGSSLVVLYRESGDLDNAHKVFEEMPEKNVVSWTALILGFAREWRVDICLELYSKMRNSTSDPNDYTFTALLTACTGSGALRQGTSVHCQTLQTGFKSYLHISNALISMYCKCGDLKDAFRIFDQFANKNVVSWNSMIAGYAQHGLATQAIELFEVMMAKSRTKPNEITYLGVISSCRHAGLIKEGRKFFNLMAEHSLKPELNHYSCMIDLLGRFGLLQEALELIENMPMEPNAVIWGSLLFSCRVHGDVWTGIRAAEERLILEPGCAATHVQLANLYASVRYWKEAATVRKVMKEKGLRTNPGCSWIEIDNDVFMFKAADGSNSRISEIVHVLHCLTDHMGFFWPGRL